MPSMCDRTEGGMKMLGQGGEMHNLRWSKKPDPFSGILRMWFSWIDWFLPVAQLNTEYTTKTSQDYYDWNVVSMEVVSTAPLDGGCAAVRIRTGIWDS